MLPNGWRRCSFSEIARIDVARDLNESSYSPHQSPTHRYAVYSNTVQNRGLYGYYDFEEYGANYLTVVARGIGLGRAFSRYEGFGAIGRLLVLSPKNNAFNVHYLADYINFCVQIHFENGAIPQLPGSTFGKYLLDLPPLPEQQKIAEILSTWDRAIAVQEKLVANARAQKKALMQKLLTAKRRLPGFEGEWRQTTLGFESIKLQTGPFGSQLKAEEYCHDGEVAVVMPKELVDGILEYKNSSRIDKKTASKLQKHRLQTGDIVFSRRGDIARTAVVLEDAFEAICGTGCLRARLKTPNCARFFSHYLRAPTIREWLTQNAVGQTLLNLNTTIIGNLPLTLPPLPEQQKIAEILSSWDRAIEIAEQNLQSLRQEKSALMQQLLTGKRRVKLDAVP